jgi:HEAT repeat protein
MKYQKLQTSVRSLVALVACAGAVFWAWRHVAESSHGEATGDWIRKIDSGNLDERRLAMRSLEPANPAEVDAVIAASTRALDDKEALVRVEAALALTRFATSSSKGPQTLDGERGRRVAKTLMDALNRDKDAGVRATAATGLTAIYRALIKAGVPSADLGETDQLKPEALVAAFDAELVRDPANRVPFVEAIKRLGTMPMDAPPGLLGVLDDKRYIVRAETLLALSHFSGGVDRAIPVLLSDVATNNDRFRPNYGEIAEAIRPSPAAAPILIQSFESDDGLVRETAATLLARIQPPPSSAAPVLIAAVKKALSADAGGTGSEDERLPEVRKSDSLAPSAGAPRVQPARGSVSTDLAIALAKVAPPEESVPLLIQLLKRKGSASRVAGAAGLSELGPAASAAIPTLIANMKEAITTKKRGSEDVGSRTAVSLGMIAPRAADSHPLAKDVIAVLTEALNAKALGIRLPSVTALGNFGPEASVAIPALRELTKDRIDLVREAAQIALAKIDPQSKANSPPKT